MAYGQMMAGANAVPQSFTGGEAIPEAYASTQNLRTIVQPVPTANGRNLGLDAENVIVLPDIGYSKAYRIYVTGEYTITPGTGTATAGDPRQLFRTISYNMMSTTRIHEVNGVGEHIINNLDYPVIPTKQTFTSVAGVNQFYLEFVIFLPFSETKLAGMIYKGGGSTYATLRLVLGNIRDILTLTGNAAAEFTSLRTTVIEDRIDAPAPQNPYMVQVMRNGELVEEMTEGRGFWQETSRFIETFPIREERDIAGAGRDITFDMEVSQPYLRILLISYRDGKVDSGDTILGNGYRIEFENTTTTQYITLDDSDRRYREIFKKNRPGGVHVITYRDLTQTDRDTLYTRDLGRFVVYGMTGPGAPTSASPNSYVQVVVQRVKYLNVAAVY